MQCLQTQNRLQKGWDPRTLLVVSFVVAITITRRAGFLVGSHVHSISMGITIHIRLTHIIDITGVQARDTGTRGSAYVVPCTWWRRSQANISKHGGIAEQYRNGLAVILHIIEPRDDAQLDRLSVVSPGVNSGLTK